MLSHFDSLASIATSYVGEVSINATNVGAEETSPPTTKDIQRNSTESVLKPMESTRSPRVSENVIKESTTSHSEDSKSSETSELEDISTIVEDNREIIESLEMGKDSHCLDI